MAARFNWQRSADGFVAYRGETDDRSGSASISRDTSTGKWRWSVRLGGAFASGMCDTTQAASDEANSNWPQLEVQAAELAAAEQRKRLVDAVVAEDEPDLSLFHIAQADRTILSAFMRDAAGRTRTRGLSVLIDALSRELFKFRTGERD